ncbi:MAG: SsrA-binding protein SmpB [Spirochaetales bacterium]|nr:SsrA-binding protein SmpB [Spirochaetales bacterium]RKX80655.1 MAG: SsrA-binding protein [Spirochaetota bacterium]
MSFENDIKVLAANRKARFNYSVQESIECGIELKGTEVKSMRGSRFSFSDSYAKIDNNELWLIGFHISAYPFGNRFNHDPDRPRKLLVHKQELKRLKRKVDEKGLTLVPLKFYLKRGLVKLEIGVCKGKKLFDKRNDIKRRDQKRDAEREFKNRF